MLPSRGLVPSGKALRLRQLTPSCRPRHARSFTALRGRPGTPATLSGRRPLNVSPSSTSSSTPSSSSASALSQRLGRPPASAAAFSLWPFGSSKPGTPSNDHILPGAASAPPPPPPDAPAPPEPASFAPEPAAPAYTAEPAAPAYAAEPGFADGLLDGSALLDMPSDQIGYLAHMGLDFGWGPTSMCQWLLEHVHAYTGLPWWASILGATFLFRAAILWPSLTAAENSAKMQALRKNPRYEAAMAEMKAMALKGGGAGQAKAMEARLTMKRMQEALGVSTWRMFVPLVNVPFGYGMFRLLRAMAALPVPSLETGGILWFTDLTAPDPYFILPLASTGIMYLIFRSNMRYMPPDQQTTMKYVQMAITPFTIFITVKMSAGLTFFFLTSSVLQFAQTILWHQPWLRRWKGLPPLQEMLRGSAGVHGGPAHHHPSARPVSFRIDPASSWKAPRAADDAADKPAKAAKQDGIEQFLTKPPSAVDVAKDGWNKMMGQAKESQSARNDRDVLRKAQDYEKRRAIEDEAQRYQRQVAERQYRAMKKKMAGKEKETSKWQ